MLKLYDYGNARFWEPQLKRDVVVGMVFQSNEPKTGVRIELPCFYADDPNFVAREVIKATQCLLDGRGTPLTEGIYIGDVVTAEC